METMPCGYDPTARPSEMAYQELGATTAHQKACLVLSSMKEQGLYWGMAEAVKKVLLGKEEEITEESIFDALKEMGYFHELRRHAHALHSRAQSLTKCCHLSQSVRDLYPNHDFAGHAMEPLGPVREAIKDWESSINAELLAMSAERGEPLAVARDEGEQMAIRDSSFKARQGEAGFLFDSRDLLAAIGAINTPNRAALQDISGDWGTVRLQLQTPSLEDLQEKHKELAPNHHHWGVDDVDGTYSADRLLHGQRVMEDHSVPTAQAIAKHGLPPSQRQQVWATILGLPTARAAREEQTKYFAKLMKSVHAVGLLCDELYQLDVQFMADDDRYFVFQEALEKVVLAFSRDEWVLNSSQVTVHAPLLGYEVSGQLPGTAIPPCGVQPFRGMVNYAAPLCFLYESHEPVYFMLREMWARYWCKLNAIRSADGCLIHLLQLFENLLLRHHPQMLMKLLDLGVHPSQIAMPWIQFGFVGFLEVDQVRALPLI
ncbi:unnamed protein product [Chrysoparadoxa australica]